MHLKMLCMTKKKKTTNHKVIKNRKYVDWLLIDSLNAFELF